MNNIKTFWAEKQGKILQFTLAGIMVLFIFIMIGVYIIARQANPIILDEKGRPLNAPATQTY